MGLTRRTFLKGVHSAGIGYAALALAPAAGAFTLHDRMKLVPDPEALLDLPEGFRYTLVSVSGTTMSDGFLRPGRPDGMACFAHPGTRDQVILMRNHENWPDATDGSPFGADNALAERVDRKYIYDHKPDGRPFFGGVTKVVYDLRRKRLDHDFLVLVGTSSNCAGGHTPWGSWLSCEESALIPEDGAGRNHGYVFETPASATGLIEPVPLTAMGRFAHEAASVDPKTGIVYLTEDNVAGLFYRFIPTTPGSLHEGGRLQALAIADWDSADTRNWPRDWGAGGFDSVVTGQSFAVRWVDLEGIDAAADIANEGHANGAARFCRGEGIDISLGKDGRPTFYFNCTQGGAQRCGQVWSYTPSREEGVEAETKNPGTLKLVYESPGADALDFCDNLAVAPWGDLVLCEDGFGEQYLRGLTPRGEIYDLARNAHPDKREFCGACFSPDGSVMFVNIQEPGYTFAIEGPWSTLRRQPA